MSIFEFVFYLLDLSVLLSPFVLMALRGGKVGLTSMLVWIPVAGFHILLFYVAMGCGHGSGTGGICDFSILVAYGPQVCALALFYVILKKTAVRAENNQ